MNFFIVLLLVLEVSCEGYYTVLENLLEKIVGHASLLHSEYDENEELLSHLVKYSLLANVGTLSLVIIGGVIFFVLYRRIKVTKERNGQLRVQEMTPMVQV